jgi:hypothetical protein
MSILTDYLAIKQCRRPAVPRTAGFVVTGPEARLCLVRQGRVSWAAAVTADCPGPATIALSSGCRLSAVVAAPQGKKDENAVVRHIGAVFR